MGVAGPVNADPVAERGGNRFNHRAFLHAQLDGILFAVERQVKQAFLHFRGHILDNHHIASRFPGVFHGRFGIEPATVLLDIEVIAFVGDDVGGGAGVQEAVSGLDGEHGGVGAEGYAQAAGAAHLVVLPGRPALIDRGIHPVIRVLRLADVSQDAQVGGFDETILDFCGRLRPGRRSGPCNGHGCEKKVFYSIHILLN